MTNSSAASGTALAPAAKPKPMSRSRSAPWRSAVKPFQAAVERRQTGAAAVRAFIAGRLARRMACLRHRHRSFAGGFAQDRNLSARTGAAECAHPRRGPALDKIVAYDRGQGLKYRRQPQNREDGMDQPKRTAALADGSWFCAWPGSARAAAAGAGTAAAANAGSPPAAARASPRWASGADRQRPERCPRLWPGRLRRRPHRQRPARSPGYGRGYSGNGYNYAPQRRSVTDNDPRDGQGQGRGYAHAAAQRDRQRPA